MFTEQDTKLMLLIAKTSIPTELEKELIFQLYQKYVNPEQKFYTHCGQFCPNSLWTFCNKLMNLFIKQYNKK